MFGVPVRFGRRRLAPVVAAVFSAVWMTGCVEGLEGFDEESHEVRATAELVDDRVYAAPDSYILGHGLAKRTEVRLAFNGSTLTASAGCRDAVGPFSMKKGMLRAPDLELTGRPCSKRLSEQEAWLVELLRGPVHADLASEEAHVLYIGNQEISLEMGALELDAPDLGKLTSEGWFLDRFELSVPAGSESADVPVPGVAEYDKRMPGANSIPQLSMYDEDKFEFFTGCGVVAGRFSFDETTINYSRDSITEDSCGGQRKDFHADVAPLFDGEFGYRFDGPDLVLTRHETVLRFFSG